MLTTAMTTTLAALALALSPSTAPAPAPVNGVVAVPAPVGLEAKLVDDARDGKLDNIGLLDAALIASGVADKDVPAEAKRVRAALAPAIAKAKAQPSAHKRGDVLLQALHETLLRRYAIGATEIDDVARTGEYNCLSSALLYVVAADGLVDAPRGMVTKHHAFARVTVDGKTVDVETTTQNGFDADRAKLMTPDYVKKIAGVDATPAELMEDLKHPEELPVLSLVAAVYSNRAVGLVQRGDLQAAAIALDRAQHLASGSLRSRTAAWRGGVLNGGAVTLVEQGRLDDAKALLELALDGTEGETHRLLAQNLSAVELHLAERALDQKDWTGALAHVDAARRLGARDDETGSIQARADSALAALEGSDARCQKIKVARDSSECFAGLARSLRDSDVDKALQYGRRAYALDKTAPNAERSLFFTLLSKAKSEGNALHCDAVEVLVREAAPHTAALDGQAWSADDVMGNCWARAGDAAFDQKSWAEASRRYRRSLAHMPKDEAIRGNLARVDINDAIEIARDGDCDKARTLSRRAAKVDPTLDDKATQILESCAASRAKKAADAKDWATAAAELRLGLIDAPKSEPLRQNLGTMLHNLAVKLLKDKDCDGARALLPELTAFNKDDAKDAVVRTCH